MCRDETYDKIIGSLESQGVRPDSIDKLTKTSALGFDSLDAVEFLMSLENEFDIEYIEDSVFDTWETVGDIYNYFVENKS